MERQYGVYGEMKSLITWLRYEYNLRRGNNTNEKEMYSYIKRYLWTTNEYIYIYIYMRTQDEK